MGIGRRSLFLLFSRLNIISQCWGFRCQSIPMLPAEDWKAFQSTSEFLNFICFFFFFSCFLTNDALLDFMSNFVCKIILFVYYIYTHQNQFYFCRQLVQVGIGDALKIVTHVYANISRENIHLKILRL